MKRNQEKHHILVSGHKHKNILAIGQTKISKSRKQNLLGVEIDSTLNLLYMFHHYVIKRGKTCLY